MLSISLTLYIFSFIFSLYLFNPLYLSVLLVVSSFALGGVLGSFYMWLFFSVVLIFAGGMMVLILYITSLSDNEKMSVGASKASMGWCLLGGLFLGNSVSESRGSSPETSMEVLYSSNYMPLLMFLLSYLVLVLFISVKACQSQKGALVKCA